MESRPDCKLPFLNVDCVSIQASWAVSVVCDLPLDKLELKYRKLSQNSANCIWYLIKIECLWVYDDYLYWRNNCPKTPGQIQLISMPVLKCATEIQITAMSPLSEFPLDSFHFITALSFSLVNGILLQFKPILYRLSIIHYHILHCISTNAFVAFSFSFTSRQALIWLDCT